MAKDFVKRVLFMGFLIGATLLLTKYGLRHSPTTVVGDSRYEGVTLGQLAEQNRLYRDSLLASQQQLGRCEQVLNDVASWNGPSPVLRDLTRPLARWRARLRTALRSNFETGELKASYAAENSSFRRLLEDSYSDTLQARWQLGQYEQGVQTRAGGSLAALQISECEESLAEWRNRLDQTALPDSILAWRQRN